MADKFKEQKTYLPSRNVLGPGHNRRYHDSWVPGRTRSADRTRRRSVTRERSRSPEIDRRSKYWRDHEAQTASSTLRIFELPPDSKPIQTSVELVKVDRQRACVVHGDSQRKMICDIPRMASLWAQEDLHPRPESPAVASGSHGDNQSRTTSDLLARALLRAQEDRRRRPRTQPIKII